jgi:hypothetical protein
VENSIPTTGQWISGELQSANHQTRAPFPAKFLSPHWGMDREIWKSGKDRIETRHDYEVNLKAEPEVMALHTKIDGLRDKQQIKLIDRASESR